MSKRFSWLIVILSAVFLLGASVKLSEIPTADTIAEGDKVPFTSDPGGTPVSKNITIENLLNYYDSRRYDTLELADAAAAADGKLLVIAKNHTLTANTVLASSVLRIPGGSFTQPASWTLTINGSFSNPSNGQCFIGFTAGDVTFGAGLLPEFNPRWWYSGTGDISPAINCAVSASPLSSGIKVHITGNYTANTEVSINRHRVHIYGDGVHATNITFNPASTLTLFKFYVAGDSSWQCSIQRMSLIGGGAQTKTAIEVINGGDNFEIKNLTMTSGWGNSSIGIRLRGREYILIDDVYIVADRPIVISPNPIVPSLGLDHSTLSNLYLGSALSTAKLIEVESGTPFSNVSLSGSNAFVGGKYGFYWVETTATGISSNVKLQNIRVEGMLDPTGYGIYINHNYGIQDLHIENARIGSDTNGIYLRKADTIISSTTVAIVSGVDLDADGGNLTLINFASISGTVSTGSLIDVFGIGPPVYPAGNNYYNFHVYRPAYSAGYEHTTSWGVKQWKYTGSLAAAASVTLSVIVCQGASWTLQFSAVNVAESILEGGFFIGGSTTTTALVSGTANVAHGDTAGKISVIDGSPITIKNNLAKTVTITITMN